MVYLAWTSIKYKLTISALQRTKNEKKNFFYFIRYVIHEILSLSQEEKNCSIQTNSILQGKSGWVGPICTEKLIMSAINAMMLHARLRMSAH